ncbi:hypothetical protein Leryth_001076 [Lithospermum erythrorhizon]|nr:hypothetical protein Leryth_001076 [Lithospermum erythrorhizon]
MADENETQNMMNLDLNLGPVDQSNGDSGLRADPLVDDGVNLEDWLNVSNFNIRNVVRPRRQRWRSVWRHVEVSPETRNIAMEVINSGGSGLHTGEGSVAYENRPNEGTKTCEKNNGHLEDEASGKKDVIEKDNSEDISFFDCNICLELAKDPVVTCCGHLFCWPCLFRWLHIHSDARECPVCKGEVTLKSVTPIYGRGSSTRELEEDLGVKIPNRPPARRAESWRQAIRRTQFPIPMEEMIQQLGSRFDLTNDLIPAPHTGEGPRVSPENSLIRRIQTSRGLLREHQVAIQSEDVLDLTDSIPSNAQIGHGRRLASLLQRRSTSLRAASIANLTSALSSVERLVEPYFRHHPVERDQDPLQPVDDRDSVSSIAAVIHSESQTVDTAVEIESNVSLSTLSSRRRNESSRVSDVDSGDSRAPRRRRLH